MSRGPAGNRAIGPVALFAAVAVGVVCVVSIAWLSGGRWSTTSQPDPDTVVVVVHGRGSVTPHPSLKPLEPPSPAERRPIRDRRAILRSLALPDDAVLEPDFRDREQQIVCGTATPKPAGVRTRFVYSGASSLAMLDDGKGEFDSAYRELCK